MTPPPNVPLHVRSRISGGGDRLISTIDRELRVTSDRCAVCACDVTLTGNARSGFRAAVALELEGGRCIFGSVASTDVSRAIEQAFCACRAEASAD